MSQNKIESSTSTCSVCWRQFNKDSETFYWHARLHNVEMERENLILEKALLNKKYEAER